MARKNLADASTISSVQDTDCLFIVRDGSVKRARVSLLEGDVSAMDIITKIVNDIKNG